MSLHALALFFSVKLLPLLYAVIGFGALIAIHECGHFLFCKLFGIHTPTFSIGFGPELYRKQIGKTNFRLAAIPLGGYVEIAGLAEVGQGEQEHAHITGEESFDSKPWWQKFFVLSGGILCNLLFAYIVFSILFMVGSPRQQQAVMVAGIVKESAAELSGLKPGDACCTTMARS
jgi:regulator of sigma E protease